TAGYAHHRGGNRSVDQPGRRVAEGGRQTMRSTEQTRLELLAALSQLSRIRPEWRLGQTVANLAMTAGRLDASGVWDLEDDEALAAARTLIEQYAALERDIVADKGSDTTAPGRSMTASPPRH